MQPNHRKKIHIGLFIAVILIQLVIVFLWVGHSRDERELTQSFDNAKKQNLAFVYSNDATRHFFDAQNAFVEYLHHYDLKALGQYRSALDSMSVSLDELNSLSKEDRHFYYTISRKKNTEATIITLRKEFDALLKVGVHRLTQDSTAQFMMTPYDFKKVLRSITYDSIRVSDEVIKKGMLRRIGDAIAGKYDVKREELQVYMTMIYGKAKKSGSIEDQMNYIFQSTRQHYDGEFGQLRNTYSSLRERDRELMVINKKILKKGQEIIRFYTQAAQDSSHLQFDHAMQNIHKKKQLMGIMLVALAAFTLLLMMYSWLANQYEQQIAKAKSDAESGNAFKGRLIGMLNHEMRAPLNIITNLSQKLKTSNTDKSLKSPINLMHFTANSLQVSANQILDFAKNQHTEIQLHNAKVNLKKEIVPILESLQSLVDLKSISLVTRIDPALDQKVWADAAKIHQLFYNTIGNAIKFTNKGSIQVECQLTQMDHFSRLEVSVKDTGVGMSDEDLARIFDKGIERKNYKDTIGFGDGLGLGLCKEIVELYDGEITANSQIGQGTEIVFSLFLENFVTETQCVS